MRPAARRVWVVKIGSSLLTDADHGLRLEPLAAWASQVAALRESGIDAVVVSSGAIAEGVGRLGLERRPRAIHQQQAAAAVGQAGLIQAYEAVFREHGVAIAQILLTHEDIADRRRYLNARSTLRELLRLGVVPVVNENDTVSTEEIRLGDNDTLAGLVANLVEAELLAILTDREGLLERDPRRDPEAPLLREGRAGDPALEAMAGGGGAIGRGGMRTKLKAAAAAARSGTDTVLANGNAERVLSRLAAGEALGTRLRAANPPLTARKRWLAGPAQVCGCLFLDDGAVRILRRGGKSLLAVGVTRAEGEFRRGELVTLADPGGNEIGRGLSNYDVAEARRILGQPSDRIADLLGYVNEPELVHRDNMVLDEP